MELWVIWVAIGVLCLIVEIFTLGFFFFSFGVSAISTGLFSRVIPQVWIHLFLFGIFTVIIFFTARKWRKYIFKDNMERSNVFDLEGRAGIVTKSFSKGERGYVKINGEIWSAISDENCMLGDKIKVISVEGNKLIVVKEKSVKGEIYG